MPNVPIVDTDCLSGTPYHGANCILADQRIWRQKRQLMLDGLADQHSVKWVTMKQQQLRQIEGSLALRGFPGCT
jgi:hypothetical protein